MANKKTDSRHTNPVEHKRDEGAPVPHIQPIIKPDQEKGAPIPSIQPITQPPSGSQPTANPKPTPDTKPSANQPAADANTPKPTGSESTK